MTLRFTLNTDVNMANGERSISTQDAEVCPQRRGGGAKKAHKPEEYWTSQERFLVFAAFCHHWSLSGALGITYNPHPRESQHFSMICKPNCWKKKAEKTGQAVPLKDIKSCPFPA